MYVNEVRMQRKSREEMIASTRARLIAAARLAFGQKGYAAASMDDLTAAAGLTRGALYHHFGGKEGLLEAVVQQIDGEMRTRYEHEFAAAGTNWTGFKACAHAYLDMALDPETRRIVLQDAPAVLGTRFREIDAASSLAPMTESLSKLMDSGEIKRAQPEALARQINGALVDAALWIASVETPESALAAAREAFDVLVDGLRLKQN